MGMSAEVVAIGPFHSDLSEHLAIPQARRFPVRNGAIVVRALFVTPEGSSAGHRLAKWLGISDPWDFNTHRISGELASLPELRDRYGDADVDAFVALAVFGFELFFMPNG